MIRRRGGFRHAQFAAGARFQDVTFAVAIALETLDPYNTNSTLNQAAGKAYYEGLFEFDKDLKVQKVLATDYTVSEDGLVYTFAARRRQVP